jgi:hypothetical protein
VRSFYAPFTPIRVAHSIARHDQRSRIWLHTPLFQRHSVSVFKTGEVWQPQAG